MGRLQFAMCVLTLFLTLKSVKPSGVLKVNFLNYVNPKKGNYSGGCCDQFFSFCSDCETYFEICLQSTYEPVSRMDSCIKFVRTKVRQGDNFKFGATFGANGEKNPLEYYFNNTWKGTFSIYMEIWDDDSVHILLGNKTRRDLIDKVYGKYQYLAAGPDSSKPRVYKKTLTGSRRGSGVYSPTVTTITLSLHCDPHYYDGYCSEYCKAQDSDADGHYTCDSRGRKICRKGWQGTDCKKPVCKAGCKNGGCNKPGECMYVNKNEYKI